MGQQQSLTSHLIEAAPDTITEGVLEGESSNLGSVVTSVPQKSSFASITVPALEDLTAVAPKTTPGINIHTAFVNGTSHVSSFESFTLLESVSEDANMSQDERDLDGFYCRLSLPVVARDESLLGDVFELLDDDVPLSCADALRFAYGRLLYDRLEVDVHLEAAAGRYEELDEEMRKRIPREEALATYMYTVELSPRKYSVYAQLSAAVRNVRRREETRLWRFYAHLFLECLRRLPVFEDDVELYHGARERDHDDMELLSAYREGNCVTYWGAASTTDSYEEYQNMGKFTEGEHTFITIRSHHSARDISMLSATADRREVVFPLGSRFEVVRHMMLDGLSMVQLEQRRTKERYLHIEPRHVLR